MADDRGFSKLDARILLEHMGGSGIWRSVYSLEDE